MLLCMKGQAICADLSKDPMDGKDDFRILVCSRRSARHYFASDFEQIIALCLFCGKSIIKLKTEGKEMLKGIPKILSPMLLKILCEMGHGDEIVIADGNFPSENYGQRVIRADGLGGVEILDAILQLLPLDTYSEQNFILMQVVPGDPERPSIWEKYRKIAHEREKNVRIGDMERYAFYERAKNAYAIVATGEEAIYANIILKKGVVK